MRGGKGIEENLGVAKNDLWVANLVELGPDQKRLGSCNRRYTRWTKNIKKEKKKKK